eukprot:880355_1
MCRFNIKPQLDLFFAVQRMATCRQPKILDFSPDLYQSAIINDIESCNDKNLMKITMALMDSNSIDLNELKNMLKRAVIDTKPSNAKKIYYSMTSIENIIPLDALQIIESFNHTPQMRSVSKGFKQCFDLNENIQLKERELFIENELQITSDNTIWKVKDGNIESLNTALTKSNSGDTILMNNGTYILNDDRMFNDKNLKIIGVGNNVKIELPDYEDYVNIINSKLYFKNVKLYTIATINGGLSSGLMVCSNSSLWIQNCDINTEFYGISVGANGNLCIANSIFSGKTDYQSIAIEPETSPVYPLSRKISILNCIFNDYATRREEPIISLPCGGYADSLKIFGNCFNNVDGFPIGHSTNIIQDSNYLSNIRPRQNRNMSIKSNYVCFRQDGLLRYLH